MEELVNISIDRYFNTLSKLGYKDYDSVDSLLVLIFIQELLDSNCKLFITEEEYLVIQKVLNCLYGSTCLIPYPKYTVGSSLKCPTI